MKESMNDAREALNMESITLNIHLYRLHSEIVFKDDEQDIQNMQVYELPSIAFEGLWESLIYDQNVKGKLMSYMNSALTFSGIFIKN
jgi:hypothetical protein